MLISISVEYLIPCSLPLPSLIPCSLSLAHSFSHASYAELSTTCTLHLSYYPPLTSTTTSCALFISRFPSLSLLIHTDFLFLLLFPSVGELLLKKGIHSFRCKFLDYYRHRQSPLSFMREDEPRLRSDLLKKLNCHCVITDGGALTVIPIK